MAAQRAKKKSAWIASPKNELRGLDSIAATRRTRIIFASFLGIGENQNH